MKAVSFYIPKTQSEVFGVQEDRLPHFYPNLHVHPELQITLIEAGSGTLIAGDYLGRFSVGDVFVIGKEMPHVFRCDDPYFVSDSTQFVHGITVFFDESYAGQRFWETAELREAHTWVQSSAGGFAVQGSTRERCQGLLRQIRYETGIPKVQTGLSLIHALSTSAELVQLSVEQEGGLLKEMLSERMNRVLRFTFEQSSRPISIEEVAELASLTPPAFCRYFKKRTRKSYVRFLNEIRISHACRLLLTTETPIGTIGLEVGFNTLSHFNEVFRAVKGLTPRAYRQQLGVSIS